MNLKVLLCAEGVTDHGSQSYDKRKGAYLQNEGTLQILMKKCSGDAVLDITVKTRADIRDFRVLKCANPYAAKVAGIAQKEKCTHIACHRDEDGNGFDTVYRQVHEQCLSVAANTKMKCIAIVPMRMTESWLLADPAAFLREPTSPRLPSKPEFEKQPKQFLNQVLGQMHLGSVTK